MKVKTVFLGEVSIRHDLCLNFQKLHVMRASVPSNIVYGELRHGTEKRFYLPSFYAESAQIGGRVLLSKYRDFSTPRLPLVAVPGDEKSRLK